MTQDFDIANEIKQRLSIKIRKMQTNDPEDHSYDIIVTLLLDGFEFSSDSLTIYA